MKDFEKEIEYAQQLKNQASRMFDEENYVEALLHYNRSLSFSDLNNALVPYGNKASIYLLLELYNNCFKNIARARRIDRRGFHKEKLDELEVESLVECLKTFDDPKPEPNGFFSLSFPPNPRLPFAANILELKTDEKYGRHIVTSAHLEAGDIVAVTPNFTTYINPDSRFHHCSFCLQNANLDLIPCEHCPKAMYCSRACMENDEKWLHPIDCNRDLSSTPMMTVPLKFLLQALSLFNWSFADLKTFIVDHENKSYTVFDFDLSNPDDPMYEKNLLLAYLGIDVYFCAPFDPMELVVRFDRFAQHHPLLKPIFNKKKNHKFLSRLMKHFFCLQEFYTQHNLITTQAVSEGIRKADHKVCVQVIGFVWHPLAMVLNTSCVPNVDLEVLDDGRTAWVVTRPIGAGEQLFCCYSFINRWTVQDKESRMRNIAKYFEFVCDCQACKYDWKVPDLDIDKMMEPERLISGLIDREKARKAFIDNCNIINTTSWRGKFKETITLLLIENEFLLSFAAKAEIFEVDERRREKIRLAAIEEENLKKSEEKKLTKKSKKKIEEKGEEKKACLER